MRIIRRKGATGALRVEFDASAVDEDRVFDVKCAVCTPAPGSRPATVDDACVKDGDRTVDLRRFPDGNFGVWVNGAFRGVLTAATVVDQGGADGVLVRADHVDGSRVPDIRVSGARAVGSVRALLEEHGPNFALRTAEAKPTAKRVAEHRVTTAEPDTKCRRTAEGRAAGKRVAENRVERDAEYQRRSERGGVDVDSFESDGKVASRNSIILHAKTFLPRDSKRRCLILDGPALSMSRCLRAKFPASRVDVPNNGDDEDVRGMRRIAKRLGRVRVYQTWMSDFLASMSGKTTHPKYDVVWIDACGTPGKCTDAHSPINDLHHVFRYDLIADKAIVAFTVCYRPYAGAFERMRDELKASARATGFRFRLVDQGSYRPMVCGVFRVWRK